MIAENFDFSRGFLELANQKAVHNLFPIDSI